VFRDKFDLRIMTIKAEDKKDNKRDTIIGDDTTPPFSSSTRWTVAYVYLSRSLIDFNRPRAYLIRTGSHTSYHPHKSRNSIQQTVGVVLQRRTVAVKTTELPCNRSKNTEMKQIATATAILLILSSANAFSTVSTVNKKSIQSSPLFQQQSHEHVGRRSAFEHSRTSSTELKMISVPVGTFAGILTGGLFAGGLHAIAGKSTEHRPSFGP
jgi:hypothetical protein